MSWDELVRLMGTQLKRSTTYHPQTDGQTEVVNRGLEASLRCFTMGTPAKWTKWLAWAEYNYKTSYHTSLKKTPYKVVYGRPVSSLISYEAGVPMVGAVDTLLKDCDEMLKELKATLERTQQWMKSLADAKQREVEFNIKKWVYIKLRLHRQSTLFIHKHPKLAPRFMGPFQIIEHIRPVAYKLDLPENVNIRPVFHVSQLRKAVGSILPRISTPSCYNKMDQ